ncbi:glycoside hydrolase superfamily [Abortiporus biennis]|nr:glycoside hydrolase superfamily [Abortiporus biennis]
MSGPAYDPVPWSNDHADDVPYNHPMSPISPTTRFSDYRTPETEPLEYHDDLPPGAARPRFLGAALAREGPDPRESYASSSASLPPADDYSSSVYALNADGARASNYNAHYHDDPHDAEFSGSQQSLSMGKNPYLTEKRNVYPTGSSKRRNWIIGGIIVAILIAIAVVLIVIFAVVKPFDKKGSSSNSGAAADDSNHGTSSGANPTATNTPSSAIVTGGDGSKITMDDGTTFTYSNPFGGTWYWDPKDPFNNNAQAQSFTPPLNQSFNYGVTPIRGVNLGGWLVTEPFITPALYEQYQNSTPQAIDEWTLSQNMAADTANGGLQQLENHYKTFITEQDFARIAGAGLNFVRIPIPYWAIEVWDGEPFLPKTAWKYFLKAIQWARKYGIRINLDLHSLPGSQNGWNHSGRLGTINMLNGPMGLANAQRSLDYIRIIAEFISQPQYSDVVVMFGVTNEPFGPTMGQENLVRYYLQAYNLVRAASGVGENNGPMISLHEGFAGLSNWVGMFTNADRVGLDIHPYICFGTQSSDAYSTRLDIPCTTWASNQNNSMKNFGVTVAGEWSNAINDCGLFVNGVGLGTRYEGTYASGGPYPSLGSCDPWTDYTTWSTSMKGDIKNFALASMSALQNWFFWTWKIGNSSTTGKVESPQWSYSLGLEQGWMPTDPRQAQGVCDSNDAFSGQYQSWQTGGAGADQIPASFSSSYAWPPTSISNGGFATALPTYTPTGTIPTLPVPTFTASAKSSISAGNGWANSADSAGDFVPIPTCSYLDPWVGSAAPPSPLCSGAAAKRDLSSPSPAPTTPPKL